MAEQMNVITALRRLPTLVATSGRVLRNRASEEGGAVLLITAFSMLAVLGISALVVDIGNANQKGRVSQSFTDASALAAGWELPTSADAKSVAAEYVGDNLDVTMPTPSTCPVESDVTADTVCYEVGARSIQITSPWSSNDYLVRVEICESIKTAFAGAIGFPTVEVCRAAIAEGEPPTPGGPGGPAIQAFGPADKKSFETTGNGTIWTDGNILIASIAGEAFVASGSGGVTALGQVWYDSSGGGCAMPPHCGNPGFLDETSTPPVAGGSLPQGCNPWDVAAPDFCGDAEIFLDIYRNHAIRSIDFGELALCLTNGLSSAGCEFYNWAGAPTNHSINNTLETVGPLRTGDTTNPACGNGVVTMDPGFYSTTAQYSIQGCVNMNPGIYMFAGGFDVESAAFLRGNGVLLINAHDKTVSRFTKSAVCLTGLTAGPFENFLYYQNPLNDNTFDVESDSAHFMAGVIYLPDGEARIQGADAGTIGGSGVPGSGCLGETTLLGGSIVASGVLVKSDGTLSINSFSGGTGSAGGSWVRLWE